jgi:outer membrane protein assembly factor BamB
MGTPTCDTLNHVERRYRDVLDTVNWLKNGSGGAPAAPPQRGGLGDNLFTSSVIALDADTGKIKWHYQFTPHDEFARCRSAI